MSAPTLLPPSTLVGAAGGTASGAPDATQRLADALRQLAERQEQVRRINRELEDTNRGVVALYAELEEKAERLRRADDSKSRFLSNMSHEFRTPLNSIRALTGLLLDHADGPLNDEQRTQVELVRKAAGTLAELVEDLLDLAKIEAGKVDVQASEFTVETLFSTLRGMLRPLITSDTVALHFEVSPALPPLRTDEAKVAQILRNFVSNALKFTERGEIRVTAMPAAGGRAVAFAVADTGIGIAPEHQELIFEEFGQVKGPLQRRVRGTGLGLPLCRRLAGLLGGSVTVESQPGVGSTFTATLPVQLEEVVAPEADTAPTATPALAVELAHVPILILASETESQTYYERLLRGTPYHAVAARDLESAADTLRRAPIAAIVVDGRLRDTTTWQWLAAVRGDAERARPLPAITVADDGDAASGAAAPAGAVDAALPRPLERHALLEALNRLTGWRILVVDDDATTRYSLRRLLDHPTLRVLEAADARAGWNAAHAARPELIILDLGLPDMDGGELLRRLKSDAATRDVPVVVATAGDLTPANAEALRVLAQAVVSKRELEEDAMRIVAGVLQLQPPVAR